MPSCAAWLRCLLQQGQRAREIWVLQGWVLQGCCSRWWPWHGQRGAGGSLGCSRVVLLYLSPEQVEQAGHPWDSASCHQSLAVPPSKPPALNAWSRGGRTDLPQPELQRKTRAGAFAAGTLSGREEQGCAPAAASEPLYKAAPSLASEIQREVGEL